MSCHFHDSAACLTKNGHIIAAVEEERFSRIKHDNAFPTQSIQYCLQHAGIQSSDLDVVVFYEKPLLKFDRILDNFIETWPRSLPLFLKTTQQWLGRKLHIRSELEFKVPGARSYLFSNHHESHAASAFYCSQFESATVVVIDGVGEWSTATIFHALENQLIAKREIRFPHSLGLFYSAFTDYLGFEVNDGEYKVMGLAPYGRPVYREHLKKFICLCDDGSFSLSEDLFEFRLGRRMLNWKATESILGFSRRSPSEPLEYCHRNLAASVQVALEEAVLAIVRQGVKITGEKRVCLSGGVALNCVANSKVWAAPEVDDLFVFPSSGDSGAAVGAALLGYHHASRGKKTPLQKSLPYWGPDYSQDEINAFLKRRQIPYLEFQTHQQLNQHVISQILDQKVVGWFQGRMEFGPRALGNRSLLADPRSKDNWTRVNQKIKYREIFRPLAPVILEEEVGTYFNGPQKSPFMTLIAENMTDKMPATTHVDGTSRLQTVNAEQNLLLHQLLKDFFSATGVPALINTSLNTAGMPIVCSPQDAISCFLESEIDLLVLGKSVIGRDHVKWLTSKASPK